MMGCSFPNAAYGSFYSVKCFLKSSKKGCRFQMKLSKTVPNLTGIVPGSYDINSELVYSAQISSNILT